MVGVITTDNKETSRFEEELEEIIKQTTKLSFPLFLGKKQKEEKIVKEKENIDYLIDVILKKYCVTIDTAQCNKEKIWDCAKSVAVDKFTDLPTNLQINSFLLQELMHEYASNQIKTILQAIGCKG